MNIQIRFEHATIPTPCICSWQNVKSGDVLCIVEAMKVMNEVQSEMVEIVEILAEDGDSVEERILRFVGLIS